MDEDKKCVWCNRETAMAAFGIALGLVIIGMSVDIIRCGRMPAVGADPGWSPDHYEVIPDES